VAQGRGVWDALGRLGFPPRKRVGLPPGDLVWEWRRGLNPNQVASYTKARGYIFPIICLVYEKNN